MPTATVESNEPAGTGLRLLTFAEPPVGYSRPGQYIIATVPDRKPAFFAIASSPGHPLQLLVKAVGETAEAVASLGPGDTLEITEASGQGFPIERSEDMTLVVLVNGSGISAARPVIEAELQAGLPRDVHLYYGVLKPEHRCFKSDLSRWAHAGVAVHVVIGEPEGTDWPGETGFVQEAAQRHGLCRPDVGVVLVGLPIMIEQAKALFLAAGCPPERLMLNF